jgi:N-acetylglucosaminyldiphosphoundecaprenol N-acetyl-beta-D-mannosaminyltransferase
MADSTRTRELLFGLPVDPLTLEQTMRLAETAVDEHRRFLIGVVNAAKVTKLKADPVLRDSLLEADVLLADGQSVVWASRLVRRPLPERVAGIDLFESLLGLADRRGLRVYLLGARPDVLARVQQEVATRWPGAVVAGARDGYFTEAEADEVADQIAAAHADMLFLGMTTPKKEIFLGRYGDRLGVAVQHGVGGSFDVLAGVVRRAPQRWQRLGMEWAYRMLQEPRRLARRYAVTNLAFVGLTALECVHRHPGYAETQGTPGPRAALGPPPTGSTAEPVPSPATPAPGHVAPSTGSSSGGRAA